MIACVLNFFILDDCMCSQPRLVVSSISLDTPKHTHSTPLDSLLGPVDPSFRALSGCLKFTVRRHKFNKDSLSVGLDGSASGGKGSKGRN